MNQGSMTSFIGFDHREQKERNMANKLRILTSKLTIMRGGCAVIDALDLSIAAGEIALIKGDNGSGKTTLIKSLAGLISPAGGAITINDHDVLGNRIIWGKNIAYIGHLDGLTSSLTVFENLQFWSEISGARYDKDAVSGALDQLEIGDLSNRAARVLSAGQARRVALARLALISDDSQRVWLLDEPFSALDEAAHSLVIRLIEQHRDKGGAAVISCHGAPPLPTAKTITLRRK